MFDQLQLPYTLTRGVTATQEGLRFDYDVRGLFDYLFWGKYMWGDHIDPSDIPWPDAAERLRYREGEPWCAEGDYDEIVCVRGSALPPEYALHRLASIMCDDAEAFRVLHWCVSELGGNDE